MVRKQIQEPFKWHVDIMIYGIYKHLIYLIFVSWLRNFLWFTWILPTLTLIYICKICISLGPTDAIQTRINPAKTKPPSPWSPDVLFKNSISFSAPKCWAWRFWKRSSSNFNKTTLPETNSSHLKMDGWKMSFFLGLKVYFQGRTVSFREGNNLQKLMSFPSLESVSKSEFSGSKCSFLWGRAVRSPEKALKTSSDFNQKVS